MEVQGPIVFVSGQLGFAPGEADLLGAAPRYGSAVEVAGLQSKPELNGQRGKVVGVLDRVSGRVAVELDSTDEGAARRRRRGGPKPSPDGGRGRPD